MQENSDNIDNDNEENDNRIASVDSEPAVNDGNSNGNRLDETAMNAEEKDAYRNTAASAMVDAIFGSDIDLDDIDPDASSSATSDEDEEIEEASNDRAGDVNEESEIRGRHDELVPLVVAIPENGDNDEDNGVDAAADEEQGGTQMMEQAPRLQSTATPMATAQFVVQVDQATVSIPPMSTQIPTTTTTAPTSSVWRKVLTKPVAIGVALLLIISTSIIVPTVLLLRPTSRTDIILTLLRQHTLQNRIIVADADSPHPEDRAAHWLIHEDYHRITPTTKDNTANWFLQRYVTLCLYFMHDPDWKLPTDHAFHECHQEIFWKCDKDKHHITELQLGRDNLNEDYQGWLLPDLGLLAPTLEQMDFSGNSMTGTIPTTLGLLTRLRVLRLEGNHFSGTIPVELQGAVVLAGSSSTEQTVVLLQDNPFLMGNLEPLCSITTNNNNNATSFRVVADCIRVDCSCCTVCCGDDVGDGTEEGIPFNATTECSWG